MPSPIALQIRIASQRLLAILTLSSGLYPIGPATLVSATDTGFESEHARTLRNVGSAQEWMEVGQDLYDVGDKAASVAKTLQRIHEADKRIGELKESGVEQEIAAQREMQKLMASLKSDVASMSSGSMIVSTIADQLKAKLSEIHDRLRDIKAPAKADFAFMKQTVLETTSNNPKEACAVVSRLTAGKQEVATGLMQMEKTIAGLNAVQTRLSHAEDLMNKVWSLLAVPVANIPVYYVASDIYDLQQSIGPVIGEVQDKVRELEHARDYDKRELNAREPEINKTIALYQAKHKTDPCQGNTKEAQKQTPSSPATNPSPPQTSRTVPTLSDPCLGYSIIARSKDYVHLRIQNTCERETIKVEHACTGIGLKPICKSCDSVMALWSTTGTKTCAPGQ